MDHPDHQLPAPDDEDADRDSPETVSATLGPQSPPDTSSYDNGPTPGHPSPHGRGGPSDFSESANPLTGPSPSEAETSIQAGGQRAKVSWVGRSDRPVQLERKGWLERITISLTTAPASRPLSSKTAGEEPEAALPHPSANKADTEADLAQPDAGTGLAATARDPRDEVTFVPARPEAKPSAESGLGLAEGSSDLEPVFPIAPRRNPVIATATGVGIGVVALLCFLAGPPAVLAITSLLLALAMAECYRAFQRARYQPAAAIGLVAAPGAAVAAYFGGPVAIALVGAFVVVASFCWYLGGVTRRSPVLNLGATVMGWAWVGLLGGFAGLLLDPSVFPHRAGLALLLGAVEATVAYDVGGYLFGSWLGKRPMVPRISPKKTWEGLIGGCAAAFVVAVAVTSQMSPWSYERGAVLGAVVVVLAPLGDLAESMVKRDLGLKDMGSLLPAHGGALDRIDGLLFVLPATYCLARLLHW